MERYSLTTEVLEYNSAVDPTNCDPRTLVVPSQNVLIDRQRKVHSRKGLSRKGIANKSLTPPRNAWTWNNSTGKELPQRFYDDELEVYLGTVDTYAIDAWTRVANSWSTTEIMRARPWWDATESIDLQLMVVGDDNVYEWNGAVAVVSSIASTTITKKGTTTFAQNRFYTNRNKTLTCVRTGTEYTYTGGEGTTTLTGIADTTGLIANDILVQKIVTSADKPAADRTNDTIEVFENQLILGSYDDNEVYISNNDDYDGFAYSSPRIAGEGALVTLDGRSKGFGILGKYLLAFAKDSIFKVEYVEIAVSTTLTEVLSIKKLNSGMDQGSFGPDTIIPIGDAIAYLSNEPALRYIQDPDQLGGTSPRTLSNPIKTDFDAEDFTNAFGAWHKNAIYLSSPVNSRLYILEFVEDADGKLRRYWQPPQIVPVRSISVINGDLYIHSNYVPETYKLFDSYSDISSDDVKLPIHCIAAFAYSNPSRMNQKNFDEYCVEGEISPSTKDLALTLNYGFGGYIQSIERMIDGTDRDILEESLAVSSLGQQSLGQTPIGGASTAPSEAAKFRTILEYPKDDYEGMQAIFSTNEIDRYWGILAHGANVRLSKRKNISIKK